MHAFLTRHAALRSRGAREVLGQSLWTFGGQGVKLAAQAAYFLLLARAIGVRQFGVLATALAIVAIAVPFAGFGGTNLMIMRTARDRSAFRPAFGACLLMLVVSGAALCVATCAVSLWVIGSVPLRLAIEVAFADLVLARVADTCSQAYQGFGRLAMSAPLAAVPYVFRASAAGAFVALGGRSAEAWGPWYVGSTALSAVVAAAIVLVDLGPPTFSGAAIAGQWRQGLLFAIGASSATVYGDIDKAMVTRLATLDASGIYAAASRAVSMAFAPMLSIFTATYYRFFIHGARGVRGTTLLARRMAPPLAALGLCAAAGIWLTAPLAPHLLGASYSGVVPALRWLALVPLLQAAFYLAGDVLTGANQQGTRTAVQVGAAALNIGLNLILIPRYSWRGAAAATLVTDVALVLALWIVVVGAVRREPALGSAAVA